MSMCIISALVDHMKKQLLRKDPAQIRARVQPVEGAAADCDFLKERVLRRDLSLPRIAFNHYFARS